MFAELSASFDSLDPEQRRKLCNYLEVRNEYLEASIKLNELRMRALVEPTAANQDAIDNYASAVMVPARTKHSMMLAELAKEAVDVQKIQEMLPMLAAAFVSAINVPLLMAALNADPDMIEKIIGEVSSFFKRGM